MQHGGDLGELGLEGGGDALELVSDGLAHRAAQHLPLAGHGHAVATTTARQTTWPPTRPFR